MEEDIKTNPKEDWLVGFKHFILLNVLRGRGGISAMKKHYTKKCNRHFTHKL
ncbi:MULTISPECIES: hypothetical protein [Helicobacter]|uniref:hypothetical protein n=1 Tax=Helicobacter TaxID=209 RepID=UPI002626596E|nr:hypothetical protein [Helicobacter sp. UBA3407]